MTGDGTGGEQQSTRSNQTKSVPFFRPSIAEDGVKNVVETLKSGWLTTGPRVAEFEKRFAAEVSSRHAVAVNSGTAALHLVLAALGVGPGDEVILPSMTFAATAEVVVLLGAKPVLVDCLPNNLTMDPRAVEKAIGEATRAIIPVHYAGQACDMEAILALTEGRGIATVEDAAHAFPARHGTQPIGSIGRATCFSFHANKPITTGEGGMITSDDSDLIDRIRVLALHGINRKVLNRFSPGSSWDYSITEAGYKYNMSDIAAALGLSQLAQAREFRRIRQRIAETYIERFRAVPEVTPLTFADAESHAWHLFVLRLQLESLSITRNEFIREMSARGVGTSVHFRPLHLHDYYQRRYNYPAAELPVSTRAFDEIVSIPIFPAMTAQDGDMVVETVRSIVTDHRR